MYGSAGVASAAGMEITPFRTFNQSPLVQIYGIPHDTVSDITPPGKIRVGFNHDYTSNYTTHSSLHEKITLDGETYRLAVTTRYGLAPRWEAGIDVPYLIQGGGFLDNFIIDWHNTFGLPQGGRDRAFNNRVNYSYSKDNVQKLRMDHTASGIGDISFTGGYRLYDISGTDRHDRLALKGSIKLPTGDSSSLLGSGSTDVMLQLCGSTNTYSEWGSLGVFGSAGGLAMSKSDVLRDQHNQLAGFGTLGFGWGPASWISFKVQLDGTTSLYRGSTMDEIYKKPFMIVFGGSLMFPDEYLLDIGVAENLLDASAPDVSFHLGLSKRF